MRFTWHSDRRKDVAAWVDGAQVAISDGAAAFPVMLAPDELDDFCAHWLVTRLDSYQATTMRETVRRLMAAWGETPQGVRFKRYGEP